MLLLLWSVLITYSLPIDNWTSDSSKKRGFMGLIYWTQFRFIPSEVRVQIGDLMIPSVIKWNRVISKQAAMMASISEIKDPHQSLLCSPQPPDILSHSYSLTHIDQTRAERGEMERWEAETPWKRSGFITSSIPSVTLYHVAIAYWISVDEMLLCPTLLPLTPTPNQESDQIIIPRWRSSMTATSAGYGSQSGFLTIPRTSSHRTEIPTT